MLRQTILKILKLNQYKQKQFYVKMINKGDLCFDIGANIGTKSRIFLSLGAKVIAFEPQLNCLKKLKLIKNNNFKFLAIGIGSKDEEKELIVTNNIEIASFSNHFLNYVSNDNLYQQKKEKVIVKKLDTVIKKYGIPNFCKIDVEGYELEIISALSYKIPLIEFEFTGGFISDTIKIIKLLDDKNRRFNYNLNEKHKFELINWKTSEEIITSINNLPKHKLHGNIFVKNNIIP